MLVILAVVILVAAFLAMVPYAILEWWSWRKIKSHAKIAEDALHSMEKPDFIEIVQIIGSPITYKISTLAQCKGFLPKEENSSPLVFRLRHTPASPPGLRNLYRHVHFLPVSDRSPQ